MPARSMDAIRLLTEDHKKVKKLFRDFERTGERAHQAKLNLAETIRHELEVHTTLEESIFYPAARAVTEELVAEAFEEHRVVDTLLRELGGMQPGDERFDAKMTLLIESVEHHAEEEEKEMFPQVKRALGAAKLRELGAQMAQRKQQLQAGHAAA